MAGSGSRCQRAGGTRAGRAGGHLGPFWEWWQTGGGSPHRRVWMVVGGSTAHLETRKRGWGNWGTARPVSSALTSTSPDLRRQTRLDHSDPVLFGDLLQLRILTQKNAYTCTKPVQVIPLSRNIDPWHEVFLV